MATRYQVTYAAFLFRVPADRWRQPAADVGRAGRFDRSSGHWVREGRRSDRPVNRVNRLGRARHNVRNSPPPADPHAADPWEDGAVNRLDVPGRMACGLRSAVDQACSAGDRRGRPGRTPSTPGLPRCGHSSPVRSCARLFASSRRRDHLRKAGRPPRPVNAACGSGRTSPSDPPASGCT